ncbi:hypothetical protein BU196_08195 [Streptomyces sp. CBMA370]|nr:hypothetical protein [Streptomyces sp. CBMA370]
MLPAPSALGQRKRTAQSDAFGTRDFVGGANDPPDLTHPGAREYDPTGLRPDGPVGGNGVSDYCWAKGRGLTTGHYTKKNGQYLWNQKPRKDPESQRRYKAYRADPANYKVFHHDAKKAAAAAKVAEAKAQARKAAAAKRKAEAEAEARKEGRHLREHHEGELRGSPGPAEVRPPRHVRHLGRLEGQSSAHGRFRPLHRGVGRIVYGGGRGHRDAKLVGDGLTTGSWNYSGAAKELFWVALGGVVARGLAGSWSTSAIASRTRVQTVYQAENVTI